MKWSCDLLIVNSDILELSLGISDFLAVYPTVLRPYKFSKSTPIKYWILAISHQKYVVKRCFQWLIIKQWVFSKYLNTVGHTACLKTITLPEVAFAIVRALKPLQDIWMGRGIFCGWYGTSCHGSMSSTVTAACIDQEVARGAKNAPRARDKY